MKVAINGFGRIGKNFFHAVMADATALKTIQIVAINIGADLVEHMPLTIKYDTLLGRYTGAVERKGNTITVNGHAIEIITALDPLTIDWRARGIDWVVDCTGRFTQRADAQKHLQAGAKKVLISAPAHDEDVSIVPGVNSEQYDAQKHAIVSLGSCTTNALMPMLKVLHEQFGISNGVMTTVHAYTNSQHLLDGDGKDPRKARAAALNIIPTSTGASRMVGKIIPELDGKIIAQSIRVPVGVVSYLTLAVVCKKTISPEVINGAFEQASKTSLKNILAITQEPLVSSDFARTNQSVTIDALSTAVVESTATVAGWYDNEWAYSVRMKEFLLSITH
ncbi:MAG: glyceraldehyde 3-phosphate dehydrogenase NAD-binding domain-containing protein [Candidatus Babeliales bacterium]